MEIKFQKHIEEKSFLHQYINAEAEVMEFYDYPLTNEGLLKRYEEVLSREYFRKELTEVLLQFNHRFTTSKATFMQINRLMDKKSVVVVGGQQAGLLTGPIYTINKVISILHEAETIEKQLGIPVIPIFWIAGEDHDIDEVNHTYFHNGDRTKKVAINERNDIKQPVSERKISSSEGKEMLKQAFQFLPETNFTKEIYRCLGEDLNEELTYVEWFASILHRLFKGTGLVLMDAAHPSIREIEKNYFKEMIENNDGLREAFCETAEQFKKEGYGEPIAIEKKNAHIFLHDQGQRYLLEKEGDLFKEKQGGNTWTESQLLEILDESPQKFSNNVVSRPVMQDKLLPVIGFISGPGELKYWGTLKKVFHTMNINMPLVYPRLHISFISRRSEKSLEWIGITPHEVTTNGIKNEKGLWIKNNSQVDIDNVFEAISDEMKGLLSNIEKELQPLGHKVGEQTPKYEEKVLNVVSQYKKKVKSVVKKDQQVYLMRFDELETEIRPNGNLQERYLNIIPYLNTHGEDFVLQVLMQIKKGHLKEKNSLYENFIYIYV
ncbi:bacillithiol biosynthesis cysteine-adding enzyme BshC [Evansella sp. AB-P1]|uniref:bacillithiol biosynthesis cysteine-adding enzyme BshC n=1 Tax=Evansella sp. AB-P1 TaxID=3037653 RepID=UPI00241CF2F3|nr:bacillithiol biosynthesis cysteine-adding enzyme BshC [Evansella sp. AB-P1]MDG5788298.1 bacillithiol biosynthesis cysteine-adding enzyme BshC [Evansella sp. AB-P1]